MATWRQVAEAARMAGWRHADFVALQFDNDPDSALAVIKAIVKSPECYDASGSLMPLVSQVRGD